MKKSIQIAISNLKYLVRNFKSTAIMFVLPVAFMGIFGIVFGSGQDDVTYDIGLIKSESTAYKTIKNDVLSAINSSEASESSMFVIQEFDNYDDAHTALEEDKIIALLEIPDDYFPGVYTEPLKISGHPTSPSYGTITSILRGALSSYLNIEENYIEINYTKENLDSDFNAFDYIAPGMMVYGILILLPNVAGGFVQIVEKQYIFRYFTSKTKAWEIILGNAIYHMIIAIINIVLLYISAVAFGFSAQGNLLYGFIVGIPTALFVVGLGMLIGAFSTKMDEATNAGTILSVILGFLSGSFIAGIGQILEFDIFGKTFQFNDFLPPKWATVALEKVLRDGKGLDSIVTELVIISVSSIIVLALGIIVYYRKHLRSLE